MVFIQLYPMPTWGCHFVKPICLQGLKISFLTLTGIPWQDLFKKYGYVPILLVQQSGNFLLMIFFSFGAVVPAQPTSRAVAIPQNNRQVALSAPVSGTSNLGVMRSEIKNGLRMVTICHDLKGKFGLKVKSVDDGIFVCLVSDGSPAAMVGIR